MKRNELVVNTPIGNLSFTVKATEGDISGAKIISSEIEPFIPQGMAVERSVAVLLRIISSSPINPLNNALEKTSVPMNIIRMISFLCAIKDSISVFH